MDDSPKSRPNAVANRGLIGAIISGCIGLAIGILVIPRFAVLPVPNSNAPADSLDLAVVITLLGAAHFAKGILKWRRRSEDQSLRSSVRVPLRRSPRGRGLSFLAYHLVLVLVLLFYFDEQSWTAESIGLHFDSIYVSVVGGALAYMGLVMILLLIYRACGNLSAQADNSMVTMAWIWPRDPRQRVAMTIAISLLNPVTEEVLFRGILVHQLSLAMGSYEVPLILGLLVSLGNHIYQGPRAILTHSLWYILVVGLMFSEAGLLGAIVMHYYGDFGPVFGLRRNLKRYRERHRRGSSMKVAESEILEPACS